MVIGGYDIGILNDVELVSLDPDVPVPPCLANLNKFPVKTRAAAGSTGEGVYAKTDEVEMNSLNDGQI